MVGVYCFHVVHSYVRSLRFDPCAEYLISTAFGNFLFHHNVRDYMMFVR